MGNIDWLTARPVAHRGLHDARAGVIENTPQAFEAAIAARYGIECDVQISADGEAMVHHDDALGRLTEGSGPLATVSAAELQKVKFKNGDGRIIALSALCDLVAGRVPLIVEIKSRFDRDLRLTQRVTEILGSYAGPAAAMSFDPTVVAALRNSAPKLTRGIVAEHGYGHHEWSRLTPAQKRRLAYLLHWPTTRPDFVAYGAHDLPSLAPAVARWVLGRPVLSWTIRSVNEMRNVKFWVDQVIFEGFRP